MRNSTSKEQVAQTENLRIVPKETKKKERALVSQHESVLHQRASALIRAPRVRHRRACTNDPHTSDENKPHVAQACLTALGNQGRIEEGGQEVSDERVLSLFLFH